MTRPAPSAALLARLARRFGQSPGHAAWRARLGVGQAQELGRPAGEGIARVPARGLHPREDGEHGGGVVGVVGHARDSAAVPIRGQARPSDRLPACGSFYS